MGPAEFIKAKQHYWLSFIWPRHYWRGLAAYPSASGGPPSNADIRGITAHKVYPINALLQKPVSSYLTFSPWPLSCHAELVDACQDNGGNFLWHFLYLSPCLSRLKSGSKSKAANNRPLTGVLPCAVRTFLNAIKRSDNPADSGAKVIFIFL